MRGHERTAFAAIVERIMTKRSFISSLLRDQTGTTMIEYALIIGGLSIVIILAAQEMGFGLGSIWNNVSTAMNGAVGPSAT
jgi:pilus assembly protein Flp/PilA